MLLRSLKTTASLYLYLLYNVGVSVQSMCKDWDTLVELLTMLLADIKPEVHLHFESIKVISHRGPENFPGKLLKIILLF